jgi:o-succinylbenzoate---CoA ligase
MDKVRLLFDATLPAVEVAQMARVQLQMFANNANHAEAWLAGHWQVVNEWYNNDPEMLAHTSGSTGQPKPIHLPKADMRKSALLTARVFDIREGADVWLPLPSSYIAGKMMIIRALVNRWKLWISHPSAHLDKVNLPEPMMFDLVPMVPSQALSAPQWMFSQIKTVLLGGGRVGPELTQKLGDIDTRFIETYGMTETITHVAWRELNYGTPKPPFKALPGVKCGVDENNCLIIWADHLTNSPVHTTDVVELLDAQHFQWLGRADNVVVTGGLKFFPEEWEEKMKELVGRPFFLTGINDPEWGQRLVLVIEGEPFDTTSLLDHWRSNAGSSFTPKEVRFVSSISYTSSQKIIRKIS